MYDRLNLTRFPPRRILTWRFFCMTGHESYFSTSMLAPWQSLIFTCFAVPRAEFLFIWCQHRAPAREFSALRHCPLFIQSPLSLSDAFASLVNKEYVAACIKWSLSNSIECLSHVHQGFVGFWQRVIVDVVSYINRVFVTKYQSVLVVFLPLMKQKKCCKYLSSENSKKYTMLRLACSKISASLQVWHDATWPITQH